MLEVPGTERDRLVRKAKAEAARKIFEEIEAKICEKLPLKIFSCIDGKPLAGNEASAGRERALYEVLALVLELKKEYTEGENTQKDYFTAEEVRKMSQTEVRKNYQAIMDSMKKW